MPFDYPAAGASAPAAGSGREPMMLKPYKVTVNGYETTLLLSDEDAKAQGLLEVEPAEKQAPKAANKARTAANKAQGKNGG